MARSLLMENREDEEVYMPVVSILISCGCRTEARGLYAAYLYGKRKMARKLKIMENEKYPLDDLKNDEITKKHEK